MLLPKTRPSGLQKVVALLRALRSGLQATHELAQYDDKYTALLPHLESTADRSEELAKERHQERLQELVAIRKTNAKLESQLAEIRAQYEQDTQVAKPRARLSVFSRHCWCMPLHAHLAALVSHHPPRRQDTKRRLESLQRAYDLEFADYGDIDGMFKRMDDLAREQEHLRMVQAEQLARVRAVEPQLVRLQAHIRRQLVRLSGKKGRRRRKKKQPKHRPRRRRSVHSPSP